MIKRRLATLLASVALTLSMASAVTAQEEESAPTFDPSNIPKMNQDEALIACLALEEELLAAGVTEEDMAAATDWLASEAANLSEKDVEELLAV